jgi:NADH dehydrogenase FAD-containing subunit
VLTDTGFVKVQPTLQLSTHPEIFAVGDVVDLPEQKQLFKAQSHAAIVAANIVAYLRGRSLKPYKSMPEVIFISIGKVNTSPISFLVC